MSEQMDYYRLLEVDPKASPQELRAAFRRLAQKYHPDASVGRPEHAELFKLITEAYKLLSDPEKRNDYNKAHGHLFHEEINLGAPLEEPNVLKEESSKSSGVEINSVQRDWSHLRANLNSDLRIGQQLATPLAVEPETEQQEVAPEVTPWGEESVEQQTKRAGFFKRLLGSRQRDGDAHREELKRNLKATISEENTPKRSHQPVAPPKASAPKTEPQQNYVSVPFAEERIYQFQVTALEAAFGTQRQLALNGFKPGEADKVVFDIPAGISDGTEIEVSRGWERVKARVAVVQDPLAMVENLDLFLRLPITLKEALDGAQIVVPGVYQSQQISLRTGAEALEEVKVEGAGISADGVNGDLYVRPYIVNPTRLSDTLLAAVRVVDQHCVSEPRGELQQNPDAEKFWLSQPMRDCLFLPISFGEAVQGAELTLNLGEKVLRVVIPKPWDFSKEIVAEQSEERQAKPIFVFPQIVAPQRISGELQGAALAIEQHFVSPPRAALPRRFRSH